MSNKKLFWIGFFILSCCEFAQVAYSKNVLASNQVIEANDTGLQSHEEKALINHQAFSGKSASYSLPR